MMPITKIITLPTSVTPEMLDGASGVHESCLRRAYHILEKVKDYLRRGVPANVLLEMVGEMEGTQAINPEGPLRLWPEEAGR